MKTNCPANLKRYLLLAWLPLVLSVLLILETLFFNHHFNIESGMYWGRCILATIGLSAIIFFPAVFFKRKNPRYLYLLGVSIVTTLVFISQFIWYRYSGGFLQASSLGYANQTGSVMGTVMTLLSYKLFVFATPFLAIFLGYVWVDRNRSDLRLSFPEKIGAFFLIVIVIVSGYGRVLTLEKDQFGTSGRLYNSWQMYDLSTLVAKIGVVNFYFESAVEYAFQPSVASAADKAFLVSWAATRTLPAQGSDFGMFKGKNIIIIQVESLENWVIGYQINGVDVAPNLTALAQEGVYFPNYYSQDGVGNTADAEFSTLNSLYPLPNAVAFISYAKNYYDALPTLLDEHGYTTAVMHGDVPAFWNRANMYPSLGYEKQFSQVDYVIPQPIGFENLGDSDFFPESLPKLESLPQPFMATLITLSTHTPFALPSYLETLSIPKDTTLTPTQQQYLEAVHYSDQAIGTFIASLKADGLYNKSIIFIWGDHSAFIGTPDSQTQHVPLIILTPNNVLHGVDTTPASHLDVYPTIADLLGIQYPITVLGQDIFTTKTPVVTQRVPGTGAIKFILTDKLKYTASVDDIFQDGSCISLPASTSLPVSDCQALYNAQVNTTNASDMVVRYNLLSLLNPKK